MTQLPSTTHNFAPLLRGASCPLETALVARFPLPYAARENAQVKSQKKMTLNHISWNFSCDLEIYRYEDTSKHVQYKPTAPRHVLRPGEHDKPAQPTRTSTQTLSQALSHHHQHRLQVFSPSTARAQKALAVANGMVHPPPARPPAVPTTPTTPVPDTQLASGQSTPARSVDEQMNSTHTTCTCTGLMGDAHARGAVNKSTGITRA